MKKSIWFSRHQPTAEQLSDAQNMGFEIIAITEGIALGSIAIQDGGDILDVSEKIRAFACEVGAVAVHGVFPVPLMGEIAKVTRRLYTQGVHMRTTLEAYASWNVSRTPEGAAKPTFNHKEWIYVGEI